MKYTVLFASIVGVAFAAPEPGVTRQIFEKLSEHQRLIHCAGQKFVFDVEQIPHVATDTVMRIKDGGPSSIELKIAPRKKTEPNGLVYDFLCGIAEKNFPQKGSIASVIKQEIGSLFNTISCKEITKIQLDEYTCLIHVEEFGKAFFVFKVDVPEHIFNGYVIACKERYKQQKDSAAPTLAAQLYPAIKKLCKEHQISS
jgi:hypothetical protein